MDGQEAALAVMAVEQCQLLMAMHDVGRVIDIQRDGARLCRVAGAVSTMA
jgi:hypothetical protein